MVSFNESNLAELSIHRVGNKANDEYLILAERSMFVDDELLQQLLKQFLLNNFSKQNEVFHFNQPDSEVNVIMQLAASIFEDDSLFHDKSKEIAHYLYEKGSHPKAKVGELYVAFFENLQIEGDLHSAIGIFKSEQKESYLKLNLQQNGFDLGYEQEGINLQKLDKGCIIFNTDKEEGFKILAFDNGGKTDGAYWKDDFLQLKVRNDNFNKTQTIMGVYKNFVSEKLDEEFDVERTDKIDLLNRSMKYFKEKETFDMEEFSNEVIANEEGIALFKSYKENYEQEFDNPIPDSFELSDAAVKKQAKDYKSILKLDKNFHVYIHGNKDLIVKDFDEEKGMNCYKLFYKEEN